MKVSGLFVLLVVSIWSRAGYAEIPGLEPQKNWDVSGYLKYLPSAYFIDGDDNRIDHLIEQRVNYEYRFNRQFHFNAALRNRLLSGDSYKQSAYRQLISEQTGFLDLSTDIIDNNDLTVNSQLDRLYLDWLSDKWQVRAGRQRINWAMATLWSPNDIFNPYSIYDVNYIERAGRDALLVQRKLGFASALEVVYSPSRNSELNSYAGRYLFNRRGWDAMWLIGKAELDYLLGAGVAGDFKGAGIRAEFTWLSPSQTLWQAQALEQSVLLCIESDYSFASAANWLVRGAALYISNPNSALSAAQFLNLSLTARTLSFARYTWYADLSFDLSALSRLTLSASYYSDGSFYTGLSNRYSLADNWQLLTGLQGFAGRAESLFGETPYLFAYGQIKWSF